MKLVKASQEVVNKLYAPGKVQRALDEFLRMDCLAVKVVLSDGEYATTRSAQSSYHSAIKKMGVPVKARILSGDLYLIKVDPDKI